MAFLKSLKQKVEVQTKGEAENSKPQNQDNAYFKRYKLRTSNCKTDFFKAVVPFVSVLKSGPQSRRKANRRRLQDKKRRAIIFKWKMLSRTQKSKEAFEDISLGGMTCKGYVLCSGKHFPNGDRLKWNV
jgi:hypothetical protein